MGGIRIACPRKLIFDSFVYRHYLPVIGENEICVYLPGAFRGIRLVRDEKINVSALEPLCNHLTHFYFLVFRQELSLYADISIFSI